DIHGNDASTSFTVTVVDNEAPVITNTPSNITVNNDLGNCSAVVTWTAPTAADNCAVDTFVSTHNPGDVFPVGTTTVTYTATDIHGNVSSTEFDVIVQDLEAPVVTCISDMTVSTDVDVCTYTIPN
ncbi:HYR domain-containing protein, partial [Arthrospira platensis SPKY1]|nr:HYR domain-containing protein [Arthrospira platensis SPKY1]